MFQSAIANAAAEANRALCASGTSYILIYTDFVDVSTGRMAVRIGSNYPVEKIGGVLGGLLEPGDEFKRLLHDLFLANPMHVVAPADPENPSAPGAPPKIIEVPIDEAVALFTQALLAKLQLKTEQPKSSLIVSG